jgi:hypothetical protein
LNAAARQVELTDVVDEAAGLGPALAEALTAGVTPESPDAVIAVLSKVPTQDPAVAAAIDARIEREPDRWLPLLPNSPDDVPRYRQLLERAMAAEPIHLALANAAVDKLIDLGVDVDADLLD